MKTIISKKPKCGYTPGVICQVSLQEYKGEIRPATDGTVRIYASDGWEYIIVGRCKPTELKEYAKKLLGTDFQNGHDLFYIWCRSNKDRVWKLTSK